MDNMIRIARKEFADLLGNRVVFLFLAIFAFLIILNAKDLGNYLSSGQITLVWGMYGNSVSDFLLTQILNCLTYYGQFVGVIVGFSIFASDRYGYSLSTLLVKPLYRDSIINGKLLGALGFLACICGFIIMLYVSCIFFFSGNYVAPYLIEFLSRLPFVFLLLLGFMMIFASLSMLLSLLISNQSLALVSSLLLIVIFGNINGIGISGSLGLLFNSQLVSQLVSGLSPLIIIRYIFQNDEFFNPANSIFSALAIAKFDILWLVLYAVIPVVLSYIVFLRRDVS